MPFLVKPPAPLIAAVRLSAPAVEDAVVLSTAATRVSFSVIGAEMVKFPVPSAAGTLIIAGPAPIASKSTPPVVPVMMEVVNALVWSLLRTADPTVCTASAVTVRLAVWAGLLTLAALLKVALAPTALGMLAGFQFAAEFQLPPAARFQVPACAAGAAPK